MREKKLSLAKDFNRHIGLRYITQGPFSGEKFRKLLMSELSKYEFLVVDLDGTTGIGSSFLDEAFGGLVFAEGMTPAEVKRRVRVTSSLDESYLFSVREAIDLALPKSKEQKATVAHAS